MQLSWKVLSREILGFACVLCVAPATLNAQWDQIPIGDKTVQFHGFLTQGFAASDQNNFLTMKTSQGSFAFTDFGFNVSSQVTSNFRVGAQMYDRNIGQLGQWHPQLDWAVADYKFKDWFGVRAGKVKTVLGLYNDTQDMDFLHTFALLPQSLYPTDLRASTIAHIGVDIYGDIPVRKAGDIAYTGYVGARPYDPYGGYPYGLSALGMSVQKMSARQTGGDVRWNNLVNGLIFGVSYLNQPSSLRGTANLQVLLTAVYGYSPYSSPVYMPYQDNVTADNRTQFYTEYKFRRLTLDGEYSRETIFVNSTVSASTSLDQRGWYVAAVYRICKRLELGTYHSRFYPDWKQADLSLPINHIYDQVATANVMLNHFWYLKLEGHFMNGYGQPYSFQGFYPQSNPDGLKPTTNMFLLRTGFYF
ncbi:MAG TPA: hypothetical protein VHZ07_08775 [Bryobacteraceae bacterium]|jgi:hypothetical protein|nr:hypothetical protein [Bryobacteraceae bacterium]